MDDPKKAVEATKATNPAVARMQAARAAKGSSKGSGPDLTPRQKFLLANVRQAGKACKLLATMLSEGLEVTPEAAEACNVLCTEFVKATAFDND